MLPNSSVVRLSSWTLVYGTARASGRLFFETLEMGWWHVGLCGEYFRVAVMSLGVEDASGNGFEVFVYYEMGSIFAL